MPRLETDMFKNSWFPLSNNTYRIIFSKHVKFRLKYDWILPLGYDTGIKIYNRINKEKVPLVVLNKHLVKWYICGPTVYDVAHIGHASCYLRFDIIRRVLDHYFDLRPIVAIGITDVDDKIIKKSIDAKVDFKSLTKQYEFEFFDDLNSLNILFPNVILRVSDHITDIIQFIRKIIEKKHAYIAEDGNVYFDSKSLSNYGKLCSIPQITYKALQKGQKCHLDFSLWKKSKVNEPFWESPWGKGRPGWHIECSAMSSKVFGSNLDIHSGGIDLLFPHHENEEAQSCAYHDCEQWVNYWLHAGSLQIKNEKMSKSLLNFISVKEFLKSYNPDILRMFCLISHYRKGLNYDADALKFATDACDNITSFLSDTKSYVKGQWIKGNIVESELLQKLEETERNVVKNLSDDFNTTACFDALMDLIKTTAKMMNDTSTVQGSNYSSVAVAVVSQYIEKTFEAFGFKFNSGHQSQESIIDSKIDFMLDSIINFRQVVRKEALSCTDKKLMQTLLKACDSVRDELRSAGIGIQDQSKDSSSWGNIKTYSKK